MKLKLSWNNKEENNLKNLVAVVYQKYKIKFV